MTQSMNYLFNINGNFEAKIDEMSEMLGKFNATINQSGGLLQKLSGYMVKFNVLVEGVNNFSNALSNIYSPMLSFDSNMKELEAMTGLTAEQLDKVNVSARDTAKIFGIDASGAVESYKLLLSQLSPELAKQPEALAEMGNHVAMLSKLMGGDAVSATEVLTTAMNQYSVDLSNPQEASKTMAEMMNIMASAGREGSAELPAIGQALAQAGMMSRSAGLSFAETNAAIQVLDKSGKKASEGGVALRNVLSTLAQGRFLPKDVRDELSAVGIDVAKLTNTSISLSERLAILKPKMADTALMTKLFGKENAASALALISQTDEIDRLREAISNTNTVQEQADIIMESYVEKQARIKQQFEDIKIRLALFTGDFGIWITTIGESIVPIAQLLPVLGSLGSAFLIAYTNAKAFAISLYQKLSPALTTFYTNTIRAKLSVFSFAFTMIANGIKALGYYILSLFTAGGASASFSAMASASFSAFSASASVACRVVSTAIASIPIIGWIAIAITAIAGLSIYLWNKSVKFRAVIKGLWAYVKEHFSGIWEMTKTVFSAIGELIISAFKLDGNAMNAALDKMKNGFVSLAKNSATAFKKAYDDEMANADKEQGEESNQDIPNNTASILPNIPSATANMSSPTASTLSNKSSDNGASKIKNINIHIDRLIDRFEVHSDSMENAHSKVKGLVLDALMSAVNDVNLV